MLDVKYKGRLTFSLFGPVADEEAKKSTMGHHLSRLLMGLVASSSLAVAACHDPGNIEIEMSSSATTGGGQFSNLDGCTTDTLATNLSQPQLLIVRNNAFYTFEQNGDQSSQHIVRRNADGSGEMTIVAGLHTTVPAFDVDATNIYWVSSSGDLIAVPLGGGANQQIFENPSSDPTLGAVQLVVDDHAVYWTTGDGFVKSRPLAGGDIVDLFTPGPQTYGSVEILVDSQFVYWSESDTDGQTVKKVPIGGGAAVDLLPERSTFGASIINGLVMGDGKLYALSQGNSIGISDSGITGNGVLIEIPLDESVLPRFLVSALPSPRSLVADDLGVYLGGISGATVNNDPEAEAPQVNRFSHGTLEVVAPHGSLSSLALCPGGVCWTDPGSGKLMRYNECSSK